MNDNVGDQIAEAVQVSLYLHLVLLVDEAAHLHHTLAHRPLAARSFRRWVRRMRHVADFWDAAPCPARMGRAAARVAAEEEARHAR